MAFLSLLTLLIPPTIIDHKYNIVGNTMCNAKIIEQILSKPIEHLIMKQKRLPNI